MHDAAFARTTDQDEPSFGEDSLETRVLAPDVLLTSMRGRISAQLAHARALEFRTSLVRTKAPRWVIDQLDLTGFDASAVAAGARWFEAFQAHDGREIVFVSDLAAARMVAASLAFAVRVKIVAVVDLEGACAHVGLPWRRDLGGEPTRRRARPRDAALSVAGR